MATFILALLLTASAFGQAPTLLWSTNVGATLFAVDANTNAYANVGGSVIVINPNGVPVSTNVVCPKPGLAQRDASGNFLWAGNFDGTQNFGGITLVGGWTNWPSAGQWTPGYPTHFVAKYNSAGVLQWVRSFGQQASTVNQLKDLLVDSNGGVYAGHLGMGFGSGAEALTRLDNAGNIQWSQSPSGAGGRISVKLGGLTSSNFCSLYYHFGIAVLRKDLAGNNSGISTDAFFPMPFVSTDVTNGTPVLDNLGNILVAGRTNGQQLLCKFGPSGSLIWAINVNHGEQWPLARDASECFYFGSVSNVLIRFDANGNELWSTNHRKKAIKMIVGSSGDRFVSFADGSVARIATDPPPQAPDILSDPQGKTVFTGSNVTLLVAASGTPPLRYFWQFNGTNLPNATNAVLNLSNLLASQSGNYSVLVTNAGGSITSAPALLRVKAVQFFLGGQMLTNGNYSYLSPPTLTVRSAFTNGSSFYTLDGSAPTFAATPYTGPFVVGTSATVRALGYSSDFSRSEEADIVNISLSPTYSLAIASMPGGNITLNPPGGVYPSDTVVTATATPANGWSFLYWLGDASGTNPSANVTINVNKSVQAVFGTTLSTTVAGNGQVVLYPAGGVYPHGTIVRLTGVPQPGNYFGVWGNAASGNTNPLYFTITSPSPTVSSLFATTPAGQSALTVVITGRGQVAVNPRANAYATNQPVTLTATPDEGASFLGWGGDASGTVNPLTVNMDQGRVVVANFTGPFRLRADRPGIEGLLPQGFRFTVVGDPFATYQIYSSTNLSDWTAIGSVTNVAPETQFTDPGATNATMKFYKATQ